MALKLKNWQIFFILLIFAAITRLIFLDLRPLHHDEGNNYFFTQQIFETGKFVYSSFNYHGPLYFFFLFLSFLFFGISEFSLRLPAALFGIFLIVLPLPFLKKDGKYFVLPSLFLLLSPSLYYYSRYSIHEIALVFFSMGLLFFATKFLAEQRTIFIPYIFLFSACIFATKETGIISIAIIGALILFQYKKLRTIDWKKNSIIFFASLYLFIMAYYALFSWFFMNPQGLIESFHGFLPWLRRGVSEVGHIKPWFYYLKLILLYEPPLAILSILGIISYFKTKNIYVKFFSFYVLGTLSIYSLIPYKMPWIVINITAPMCVLAGFGLQHIFKKARPLLGAVSFIALATMLVWLNFFIPWQEQNLYAYVHTNADVIPLVKKINTLYNKESQILIASKEYWPLPFYFHGKAVQYMSDISSLDINNYPNFNIFIVQDSIVSQSVIPENYIQERYILRPGVELYLVYKNNL